MSPYANALDYLYNQRPAFERQGAGGYKPGLATTLTLAAEYGNPHEALRTIHVAGTNGKGSVSHLIASVLQEQGYKVGLYTSPHFVDFAERIKVNGNPIPHERIIDFVADFKNRTLDIEPSFFELTTILAFQYFKESDVDFAVIEVGLGGRLDSTNIITPMLSVITSIALDHTDFLGNTLAQVAGEKAGIIKPQVPVVTGNIPHEALEVIKLRASELSAPCVNSTDLAHKYETRVVDGMIEVLMAQGKIECQLAGEYQRHNILTALAAIDQLKKDGIEIEKSSIANGFSQVCDITGFRGRWTVMRHHPMVICDSAHNPEGIKCVMAQLDRMPCKRLHMVMGFMKDKDVDHILALLPTKAQYFFTQANTPRAMSATELRTLAQKHGLEGKALGNVEQAYNAALDNASPDDIIYVGGSMYVLADFFTR